MKPTMKRHLDEMGDAAEAVALAFDDLSLIDQIDVFARLQPVAKHIKKLDESLKEDIKKKLKEKEGTIFGTLFKAVLKIVPTKRLNQKRVKDEYPDAFEDCNESTEDKRITFEVR